MFVACCLPRSRITGLLSLFLLFSSFFFFFLFFLKKKAEVLRFTKFEFYEHVSVRALQAKIRRDVTCS
jgi:hypothetical protein